MSLKANNELIRALICILVILMLSSDGSSRNIRKCKMIVVVLKLETSKIKSY